jgi:transcriptional regulator with XRE-family HTH domain
MRIGQLLACWRSVTQSNIRDAAKRIGISYSTLSRIENGEEPNGRTLAALLRWALENDTEEHEPKRIRGFHPSED